ncbi:TRAP transporter small permease subunit [Nitrosococcus wardiae]|uniref:TRAP transporter small permease protein n=1 Tax=Nitrosococcus wardiae TaxID=1814290 RepID=A0A4P7BVS7_9GAMM|nr:TRAP transporter small permease subunit [Nitrosococcus wardiae]QBQ53289.1 TRAP transporter small permease subunit [Nitrosococcus wardiae]
MGFPEQKLQQFATTIDKLNSWTGRLVAWLVLLLVLLVCYDVSMRYLFQSGSVALQELEWHLFALIFLLGAAPTLKNDGHVRVDVFYQSHWFSPRTRIWINLLGTLAFLLPFCLVVITASWPFVRNAFLQNEGSPDPGGLPYRYLLKAVIPLAFSLLALQGIADLIRNLLKLRQHSEATE